MLGRPFSNAIANPSSQSVTVSTSGHKIAPMVQIPKTGNVTSVRMALSSTVSGTVTVTIETIDPATGNPTGTLIDANATQTITLTGGATQTVYAVTFPGNVPVTQAQYVAVVITNNSTDTKFYSINNDNFVTFPCTNVFTGSWAKNASSGAHLSFGYDDGTFPPVMGSQTPILTTVAATANTGTNPKIYGNIFNPTFNCKISGIAIIGQFNGSFELRLYAADGATVLATTSIDYRVVKSSVLHAKYYLFSSDIDLTKNTSYRLAIVPLSATSLRPYQYSYSSLNDINNTDLGSMLYQSTANTITPTGTGDWTNTTTTRVAIWPMIAALDDGIDSGGGGGGVANKRIQIFGFENFIRVSR